MSHASAPLRFVDPHLGGFIIETVLGWGAMGRVLRVRDEQGRAHALKLPTHLSRERVARLRREADVLSTLDHPNIVSAHGVVDVFGQPGLLMELIDGPHLGTLLAEHELHVEQIDQLTQQVLAGMSRAHAAGLVHRDLKPGNVLLARSDAGPVAKVSDFGLVKQETDDHTLTATGVMVGTHGFVAPEQVRDAGRADSRSDVFSLGALIYAMATGASPFHHKSAA